MQTYSTHVISASGNPGHVVARWSVLGLIGPGSGSNAVSELGSRLQSKGWLFVVDSRSTPLREQAVRGNDKKERGNGLKAGKTRISG